MVRGTLTDPRNPDEHFGREEGTRAVTDWEDGHRTFRQPTRTVGLALEDVDDAETDKASPRRVCLGCSGASSLDGIFTRHASTLNSTLARMNPFRGVASALLLSTHGPRCVH